MKASELRIGNWVLSVRFDRPVVLEIGDFGEAYAHADGSDSLEWFETHLEPILLTEEWLLKFGFEYMEEYGCFKFKNLILNKSFVMMDIDMYVECKHVHQLQNLYYALTGEELTIKEAVSN